MIHNMMQTDTSADMQPALSDIIVLLKGIVATD